jgi:membrane dipeptidase
VTSTKVAFVGSRRSFLGSLALVVGPPMLNRGRFRLFAQSPTEYSTLAIDLVRNSTVIDMLGLLTLDYRKLVQWQRQPAAFLAPDLERLKASGTTIFHPAVGFTNGDIYAESLSDMLRWNAFLAAHKSDFLRIDRPADIERAKTSGKLGILLGLQNSSHFRSIDDVNRFYALGQRVSQLTYMPNRIGGGSNDPNDSGLTEYGAAIVARMNQLGMAIDISHCADRTTMDAIAASRKPVLVTHSNCRQIVPGSARCKTDQAIQKLAERGGVMGITMVRFFVSSSGAATIENVLDHIQHVARVAGIEHVGIGTDVDLDGRDHGRKLPHRADIDGLDYGRKIFDVTEGLIRRGHTKEQIELILGGNFRRALAEIWRPDSTENVSG